MDKILGTPKNGWSSFSFGPFRVQGISYLTEVHWDLMEFFTDCLTKGVGIVEFDREESGKCLLTFSSFGMELRGQDGRVQSWFPSPSDLQSGAITLLTDLVIDFNSWIYWSAMNDEEVAIAAEDLSINLESFCTTLINVGILNCDVTDMIPANILETARKGKTNMAKETQRGDKAASAFDAFKNIAAKPDYVQPPQSMRQQVPGQGQAYGGGMQQGQYAQQPHGQQRTTASDIMRRQMQEQMRRGGY